MNRSRGKVGVALVIGLFLLGGSISASHSEKPRDRNLVLAGLAMGIPTYALGVSLHEGSHALAAKLIDGVEIVDYSLVPGFHPRSGKFYFGYVSVVGLRTESQRAWFLVAPKLTDTALLGGFSLLYATGGMPSNHYAQTAVLVLATGFWVDFSRDIIAWWDHNDTVKLYNSIGADTEWKRLPLRILHAGIATGLGYAIVRGYADLFRDEGEQGAALAAPIVTPLWQGSF